MSHLSDLSGRSNPSNPANPANLVFTRDYPVSVSSLDNYGRVRPSFWFAAMQDTAVAHMEHLGLGKTALPVFWVLSRIALTVYQPFPPQTSLQCQTWCAAIRGASPIRMFTFTTAGGKRTSEKASGKTGNQRERIAEAQSMWVMLDPVTRRIVRPTAFGDTITQLVRDPTLPPPAALPKLSGVSVAPHHTYTVRYSDLDENNHLNNVRAVELVCDTLHLEAQPDWVSFLQINYTAETRCGETLLLSCGQPQTSLNSANNAGNPDNPDNPDNPNNSERLTPKQSICYVQGTVDQTPHFEAVVTRRLVPPPLMPKEE